MRAGIVGHFGNGETLLNGQTIKTKIVTQKLECRLGSENILRIDTHGGIKKLFSMPFVLLSVLKKCRNVVIFPAHNGLRVIAPVLAFENLFFKRKLHYVVIGGWLPEFVKRRNLLSYALKKFDCIYVETNTMKKALELQEFTNIIVMPNCKELKILKEDELVYSTDKPYKLCTFSRVMKEKGIEDAIDAVKLVNEKYGETIFSLDIYGQVDPNQTEWFESLKETLPEYINYGGCVDFDKSTDVLKKYYALLFPTYYDGEGFAGTLIDAFAAGVPVIASDWRYNPEIVKSGITGMIYSVKDSSALADKLIWIYENNGEWTAMKVNCIKESQKHLPSNVLDVMENKMI